MTDEEKKAIEIIKFLQDKCIKENGTGMMPIYRIDDLANAIKILLNLIENQQKEIEELKKDKLELINKNHVVHIKDVEKELLEMRNALDIKNVEIDMLNNMIDINYISKNKIKAKIEEYRHKNFIKMQVVWKHDKEALKIAEVLQSLLEEE